PEASAVVTADDPVVPVTAATEDFSDLVFAPRFAREPRRKRSPRQARAQPRRPRAASGERHWPWLDACVLLSSLLLAQFASAERDALIRRSVSGGWPCVACSRRSLSTMTRSCAAAWHRVPAPCCCWRWRIPATRRWRSNSVLNESGATGT